jgi:hypothetical protein
VWEAGLSHGGYQVTEEIGKMERMKRKFREENSRDIFRVALYRMREED